ncbi:MAG: hypothetical protein QCI38_07275 [Candidatus Thermoplasmatota archaeon]|nr:hypothetical protein [Candidatus Thermoplasmatota archaeon]
MKLLRKDMDNTYYKIEDAMDFNKMDIEVAGMGVSGKGFGFFRGMGVTDYPKTFKMWLREFPRPIFLVCIKGKTLLGWVYIEEWGVPALDGEPVYVLRAIEVMPQIQHRRIGAKLALLGMTEVVGYLLTKPLTPPAEKFFKKLGFMEPSEFRRVPVDLSHHYGYLLLPPFRRKKVLENIDSYFRQGRPQ